MEALLAKALPEMERHLDFLDTRRLATSHTLLKATLHQTLRREPDVLAKLANDQAVEDAEEVWSMLSDAEDDEARTHSPLVFFRGQGITTPGRNFEFVHRCFTLE